MTRTTRRDFIQTTGVAGAAWLTTGVHTSTEATESRSPNDKLNIGIIGSGGRGRANLGGVSGENIYALCDVYDAPIAQAKKAHPNAKTFYDWRKLIDDDKLDAVVISTADHHHALAAVAAMRAGLHVYCEKPLAHTVREARIVQDEYKKRRDKIATQMGTQIHARDNYRRVVELIQAGAIGKVREAHVWCSRGIRPVGKPVLPSQEKPADYHWDVFLGPASERAYNSGYWKGGNLNWNRRWEFGNGVLGDMGSHLIDLPFWALSLKHPTSVVSEGPEPDSVACPPWQVITWEHPARVGNDSLSVPVKVIWYHGKEGMQRRVDVLQKRLGGDTDLRKWGIGAAFVGDDGILVADYGKRLLSPKADFVDHKPPEQTIPKSRGHHAEWIHACKTGAPTLCNFDYSGALIEHNLLGNVAHRAGAKLLWDAKGFEVTNTDAAAEFLTKSYRAGWKI
jgi:predicted dehydrogenase